MNFDIISDRCEINLLILNHNYRNILEVYQTTAQPYNLLTFM